MSCPARPALSALFLAALSLPLFSSHAGLLLQTIETGLPEKRDQNGVLHENVPGVPF